MENKRKLFNRWVEIIRDKAIEYEAQARKDGKGETVSNPDLLDIANEIDAFACGLLDN